MTRPLDFLLVGAPRSGTTSLFRYLRTRPELVIPAGKELPYFSDEERFARGWEAFAGEFFTGAAEDKLWGKLAPHYWSAPAIPSRLRRAMPAARLIALLRKPEEIAGSPVPWPELR